MKILVVIKRSPPRRYLMEITSQKLAKEVGKLMGKGKNSQAIAAILSKGRFEREISDDDLSTTKADVIISEENVSWDLK